MKQKISLLLLILAFFLFAGITAVLANHFFFKPNPADSISRAIAKKLPGGDFTLQSADGKVSLSDFKGKVVLLYFGYTYCPDICPTALTLMGKAINGLDDAEKKQVQGLFISVDPERDTPEKLKKYSAFFNPNIIGLTGKKEDIDRIVKHYGSAYEIQEKDKEGRYTVDHSSITLLIGKDGKIKDLLAHGMPSKKIIENIRNYL